MIIDSPGELLPGVCTARAAVNESVCEDLQVHFVLTIAEVILEI